MNIRAAAILSNLFLVFFTSTDLISQDIQNYEIEKRNFEAGMALFEDGLYQDAKSVFEGIVNNYEEINAASCTHCPFRALFLIAECKYYLEEYDAEIFLKHLIRKHGDEPLTNQAIFNIGNWYFSLADYRKARQLFQQIDRSSLNQEARSSLDFRMGYIEFLDENYELARDLFQRVNPSEEYSEDARFYYGLCNYKTGDLIEAQKVLLSLEDSKFRRSIPYYLARIKAETASPSELIAYLDPILVNGADYEHYRELLLLHGEAHYELENYEEAVESMGKYYQFMQRMERTSQFKLAHSYFKLNNCEKAIFHFGQLSSEEDELYQISLYNIGQCYLRNNDRRGASSAFYKASLRDADPDLKYESLYLYGLLAMEERAYDEALSALMEIPHYHKRYKDVLDKIAEIVPESRNYDKALEALNGIDNWTISLKEAFQVINFKKGLNHLFENEWEEADRCFSQSLKYPFDTKTRVLALFWKADVTHTLKKYLVSNQLIEEFIIQSPKIDELPQETSLFTAYYLRSYNYLKQEDYSLAVRSFEKLLDLYQESEKYKSEFNNLLYADAVVRSGDCYLKMNLYNAAESKYDLAISEQFKGYEYAQYSKAIILGLKGQQEDKLTLLDLFIHQNKGHELVDDALFEMGETFLSAGKYEQAKRAYSTLVRDHSDYSDKTSLALLRSGLIAYNEGNYEEALNYYRTVFNYNPDKMVIDQVLNSIQEIFIQDLNKPDDYFDFLSTLPGYKVDPSSKDSLSYVASVIPYQSGKYETAIQTLRQYLDKYPKGVYRLEARFKLADSYLKRNNFDSALENYDQIVDAGPGEYYVSALKKMAFIYYENMKAYEKALDYFDKYYHATSDNLNRKEALIYAMKSAFKAGNSSKLQEFSRAIIKHPKSNNKDKALVYYYRGKEAFDKNDFQSSLSYFNKVTDLNDGKHAAEARYLMAKMYFINREIEIADRLCQFAINENSNYPYWIAKCLILQADIQMARGDDFEASAALEAVIENYTNTSDGIIKEAKGRLELINRNVYEDQ